MAASFSTTFNVGGSNYVVNECSYNLTQPTDIRGRASAGARSGLITITVTGSDYQTLVEWAINPFKAYTGTITYLDMYKSTFKTVKFEQGYCVSYEEEFTPHSGGFASYTFHLGITAAKMHLNGTLHDNMWMDWKFGE